MWCERCQAGPGGCMCGIRETVRRVDSGRLMAFLVREGILEPCQVSYGISSPNMTGQITGEGYRIAPPKPPKLCSHCGEEIEPWTYSVSAQPGPQWRHVANGSRQCQVLAEPA